MKITNWFASLSGLLLVSAVSQGATITWNFTDSAAGSTTGPPVSLPADFNVGGGVITRINNNGVGGSITTELISTQSVSNYGGASGTSNAGTAAFTGALNTATSTAFEFTLTPASSDVTFTDFDFGTRSTSTGAQAYSLRSSLDGYASDIFNGTIANNGTWSFKDNLGFSTQVTAGNPIMFRLYGYNGTGSPSLNTLNWRIDDLVLTYSAGVVAPTFPYWDSNGAGAGAGGTGTWDTAQSLWNGAADGSGTLSTYDAAQPAIFGGTAGTVTIAAPGVIANGGIQFEVDGYVVDGSTLELGDAPTIRVGTAGQSATIAAQIVGDNGLTKNGLGNLNLTAASNTFTGVVSVNAGTLTVATDAQLGDAGNNIALGGGTLKFTSSVTLAPGRDLSGAGSIDIAAGDTVTVDGNSVAIVTLPSAGTLVLNGPTKGLNGLTFLSGGTVRAGDGINDFATIFGNINANLSSGTATIEGVVDTGSFNRTITVASGGTLVVTGALLNDERISVTGAGTFDARGDNVDVVQSFSLGSAGNAGPKMIINNANSLGGVAANSFRFNSGELNATVPLTGVDSLNGNISYSVGAYDTQPATFSGEDMRLLGPLFVFKNTGDHQQGIRVNNTVTLFGGLGASEGGGTSTGVTISGTGMLVLPSGSVSAHDLPFVVDAATFVVDGIINNPAVSVSLVNGGTLAGSGTIGGTLTATSGTIAPGNSVGTMTVGGLSLVSGSILDFEFSGSANDLINTTTAGSLSLTAGGFNLYQEGTTTPFATDGIYNLIGYSGSITGSPTNLAVLNPQGGKLYSFGSNGSFVQLTISTVPEPSSLALATIGLLFFARRRKSN